MASARTLKRRSQRRWRKHHRGKYVAPSALDTILKAFYTDAIVERWDAQSALYDRLIAREPVDVNGRAYTYCIYTNPKAHLEP